MGEGDRRDRDYCQGSGANPSLIRQSLGGAYATWGSCPVCEGSYRVDKEGLLVEHRPAR